MKEKKPQKSVDWEDRSADKPLAQTLGKKNDIWINTTEELRKDRKGKLKSDSRGTIASIITKIANRQKVLIQNELNHLVKKTSSVDDVRENIKKALDVDILKEVVDYYCMEQRKKGIFIFNRDREGIEMSIQEMMSQFDAQQDFLDQLGVALETETVKENKSGRRIIHVPAIISLPDDAPYTEDNILATLNKQIDEMIAPQSVMKNFIERTEDTLKGVDNRITAENANTFIQYTKKRIDYLVDMLSKITQSAMNIKETEILREKLSGLDSLGSFSNSNKSDYVDQIQSSLQEILRVAKKFRVTTMQSDKEMKPPTSPNLELEDPDSNMTPRRTVKK